MAPPPPKKTLTTEDVPGAPEWLGRLLDALNASLRPAAEALAQALTFRENFAGEVRLVEVTPPDDWVSWNFGTNWSRFPSDDFPVPGWQKALDGWVRSRGLIRYTGPGSPGVETLVVSGAPPPSARGRFLVDMSSAPGLLTGNVDGSLVFGYGNASLVSLADIEYEAADRSPSRWATPVDVKLGTPQRPFPGRPGQVLVLRVQKKGFPLEPAAVTALDWTATNLDRQRAAPGVRIHRAWGLVPGITYNLLLLILPE